MAQRSNRQPQIYSNKRKNKTGVSDDESGNRNERGCRILEFFKYCIVVANILFKKL